MQALFFLMGILVKLCEHASKGYVCVAVWLLRPLLKTICTSQFREAVGEETHFPEFAWASRVPIYVKQPRYEPTAKNQQTINNLSEEITGGGGGGGASDISASTPLITSYLAAPLD